MSCGFDRERLAAYAGGELEAGDRREVEEHVASCAECRAVLEGLSRLLRALRELPAFEPPPDFAAVLRERLLAHASGWFEVAAREASAGSAGRVVPLSRAVPARPRDGARAGREREAATDGEGRRPAGARGGASLLVTAAVAALALVLGWGSASFFPGGRAMELGMQAADVARSAHADVGHASEALEAGAPKGGAGAAGSEAPAAAHAVSAGEPSTSEPAVSEPTSAAGFASVSAVASGPVPERPPIARTAEIRLGVAKMADAYAVALDRIAAYQSLIVASDFTGSESAEARLDVRVPSDRLDPLLASLAHVGTVLSTTVTGEDMTGTIKALHDAAQKLVVLGDAAADQAPGGAEKTAPPPETGGASAADQLAQIHDQENAVEARVNWATLTVTLVPLSGR